MRFLAPDHGTRRIKDHISRDIIAALEEANIGIASGTCAIVQIPPIEIGRFPQLTIATTTTQRTMRNRRKAAKRKTRLTRAIASQPRQKFIDIPDSGCFGVRRTRSDCFTCADDVRVNAWSRPTAARTGAVARIQIRTALSLDIRAFSPNIQPVTLHFSEYK